jgi:hypothetical protein
VSEPEYIIVQPGLGGVAWLGEIIDGEPAPIGRVGVILEAAARAARPEVFAAVEALAASWECDAAPTAYHQRYCPGCSRAVSLRAALAGRHPQTPGTMSGARPTEEEGEASHE